MPSPDEHLKRWVEAGLIDRATTDRITAFERANPVERSGPTLVEAVAYLGVLVAAVGAIILVGSNWEELPGWGRVAVVGGAGILALLAGEAFRRLGRPAMQRAGQAALLVGGALLTGAAAVLVSSSGGGEEDAALAAGLTALPLSLILWGRSPEHPQVVGVGLGIWVFGISWLARFDEDAFELAWFTIAALGVLCMAATEGGSFYPRVSARAVASVSIGAGAFFGSTQGGAVELAPFLAGLLLIAASLARRTFVYIIAGIAAVFAALVQVILRHVDDPTLAAIALMAIGVLLVGVVLSLARWRPWSHSANAA